MYPALNLRQLAIILALVPGLPVEAAEWSATPRIGIATGYDDNVRLTTLPHESVINTRLSSSVRFGVAEAHQGLFGDAGFSLDRFSGGSGRDSSAELDRENFFLNTNAYRNTQLDTYSINLSIRQDSTLDTELQETGNVSRLRATRQSLSLGPAWSRTLTRKDRVNLSARYTEITFPDDPGEPNLVESESFLLSSGLIHQFTQRVSGNLTGSFNRFQPDTGFNSDTLSLQAGFSREFSPTLSTRWLAGWRNTTSDSLFITGSCIGAIPGASFPSCTGGFPIPTGTATGETVTSGLVYTADISKTLQKGNLTASVSRSTNPTSSGELLDSTRVNLSGLYHLTERLDATLGVSYTENETIVNQVGRDPGAAVSTFLTFTPSLAWRWDRQTRITFRYNYAESDTAGIDETATRNAVSINLDYDFQKFSISR